MTRCAASLLAVLAACGGAGCRPDGYLAMALAQDRHVQRRLPPDRYVLTAPVTLYAWEYGQGRSGVPLHELSAVEGDRSGQGGPKTIARLPPGVTIELREVLGIETPTIGMRHVIALITSGLYAGTKIDIGPLAEDDGRPSRAYFTRVND